MLPTWARVRTRAEHDLVARRGQRSARGPLVVHWLNRPTVAEPPRAGFVTGRRVGSAVERNRVRRRLQHLVAARLAAVPPGTLLVVRALPGSADATNAQLGASLDAALRAATSATSRVRRSPAPAAVLPSAATSSTAS